MNYIEVHIECNPGLIEILIAELDFLGAESISEKDEGLLVSFEENTFNKEMINELALNYGFSFKYQLAEKKNWNEEWEKNFDQILIDNCSVRASFHTRPDHVDYDIVINPKMSFGTGHHETTSLMVAKLLTLDMEGATVLDMGTGTGILAILAEKRGANRVIGIDIDEWSIENSVENVEINQCSNIEILLGDAEKLKEFGNFEIIIANINRNILLADMVYYEKHLQKSGKLLLSGFYTEDKPVLVQKASELGLKLSGEHQKNNWMLLEFKKE